MTYYQSSIDDYIIDSKAYQNLKIENQMLKNKIKEREQLIKSLCKDLQHINDTLHYSIKYRNFSPYQKG